MPMIKHPVPKQTRDELMKTMHEALKDADKDTVIDILCAYFHRADLVAMLDDVGKISFINANLKAIPPK